jgi:hypothetical protein
MRVSRHFILLIFYATSFYEKSLIDNNYQKMP